MPINVEKRTNHELDNSKLPRWFYDKYQKLVNLIPKIKEMFNKFLSSKMDNSRSDKKYLESLLEKYKTECSNININLNADLPLAEVKNSIQFWGNLLDFMFMVDNTLLDRVYFIEIMQLCNSALIDIGEIDGSLRKKYLPDKWLLTSKGYLYNMQSTVHEAGFYDKYYSEKIKWFFTKTEPYICKNNLIPGRINPCPELSNTSIILESGYMRWSIIDLLLHYIDYYHFNYRIYDSKTIMISIGMIELQQDLLDFFEKLELYTDCPKDSLRRAIEITNDNYLDFLIRCCGVSKITSSPYKTIVTSLLTAKEDFR